MKILIVDDSLASAVKATIAFQKEHEVKVANTGMDAVDIIREWKPDLVMAASLIPWKSTGRDEQKPFFHGMTVLMAAIKHRVKYISLFAEGPDFSRFGKDCLDYSCVDEEFGGLVGDTYYIPGKTEAGAKVWTYPLEVIAKLPKR